MLNITDKQLAKLARPVLLDLPVNFKPLEGTTVKQIPEVIKILQALYDKVNGKE